MYAEYNDDSIELETYAVCGLRAKCELAQGEEINNEYSDDAKR